MVFVARPAPEALERLLEEARSADPTFAEVGATAEGNWPAGYRHDVDEVVLGNGDEVFDRAASAVRRWQAQLGAGIDVVPHGDTVGEEKTVLLLIRAAALWTVAPCRVIYAREDLEGFRFAYATLPGHPERGEASFAVVRGPGHEIVFRVASFSRPVDPLARLARPLTRRIQRRVTLRYLSAIRDAAAG